MVLTRAMTEQYHTPPSAHCHRAGFGHRMENGLVRVENTDKILAILNGLGYNNSVKFTR